MAPSEWPQLKKFLIFSFTWSPFLFWVMAMKSSWLIDSVMRVPFETFAMQGKPFFRELILRIMRSGISWCGC